MLCNAVKRSCSRGISQLDQKPLYVHNSASPCLSVMYLEEHLNLRHSHMFVGLLVNIVSHKATEPLLPLSLLTLTSVLLTISPLREVTIELTIIKYGHNWCVSYTDISLHKVVMYNVCSVVNFY